jgi:hypothetical protein
MSTEIGIISWNNEDKKLSQKNHKDAYNMAVAMSPTNLLRSYEKRNKKKLFLYASKNELPKLTTESPDSHTQGTMTDIALNEKGVAVEVHTDEKKSGLSKYSRAYYKAYTINGDDLTSRSSKYIVLEDKFYPKDNSISVSINNNNLVAFAYTDKKNKLTIKIAKFTDEKELKFLATIQDTPDGKHDLTPDRNYSITINDNNVILFTCSNIDNNLYYSVGQYDSDKKSISWGDRFKMIKKPDVKSVSSALNSSEFNEVVLVQKVGKLLKYKFGEIDPKKKEIQWLSDKGIYKLEQGITIMADIMDKSGINSISRTSTAMDNDGNVLVSFSNWSEEKSYVISGNIHGYVMQYTADYLNTIGQSDKLSKGIISGLLSLASAAPTPFKVVAKATKSLSEMAFKAAQGDIKYASSMTVPELVDTANGLIHDLIDLKIAKTAIDQIVSHYKALVFHIDSYKESPEKFDDYSIEQLEKTMDTLYGPEFTGYLTTLSDETTGRFGYPYFIIGSALQVFADKYRAVKDAYRINGNTGEVNGYSNTSLTKFNEFLESAKNGTTNIAEKIKDDLKEKQKGVISRRKKKLRAFTDNNLYGGDPELMDHAINVWDTIKTEKWPQPSKEEL